MMSLAQKQLRVPGALAVFTVLTIVAGAITAFPLSFVTRTNVLVGACLLPMAVFITGTRRINYAYLILCVAFIVLSTLFGVRMFYFFAIVMFFLAWFELAFGRLDSIILVLVGLMSPFFEQVSVILGFEFRLKLTQWAGALLTHVGMPVRVEGNLLDLGGSRFSVDEACAGLSMLSISLLLSFFLLTLQYRRQRCSIPFGMVVVFFAMAFLLNIIANLLRIIFLVVFEIMPGETMHDVAGLVILLVYVVIPMMALSSALVKRFGKPLPAIQTKLSLTVNAGVVISLFSVTLLFAAYRVHQMRRSTTEIFATSVTYKGQPSGSEFRGIARFEEPNLLVYVKPIPQFFSAEHTPLFCWRGSGYEFRETAKVRTGTTDVYMGRLTKNQDVLYTAWWYTNGEVNTVKQTDWRLRMMRGETAFCLVNVTAASPEVLLRDIDAIIRDKAISVEAKTSSSAALRSRSD